ncbi:FHA domain-containing protein [Streptomyces spirodelae]|uniref:FHA domain-containing protein n=1 Tax=Streptomyces spirodelae TaxID=2812904 RepID=A0ABS3WPE0_9ACTN|nr:FHA domain-containing protein [Streptomyces spirodelae]MBO8184732.1 FHA domain-containing protein [Streptomyces spirodelae]
MQIRLTVALAPRGARGAADAGAGEAGGAGSAARSPTRSPSPQPVGQANVLVTAPAGTVLSAVTNALAASAAAALATAPAEPEAASGPAPGSGSGPGSVSGPGSGSGRGSSGPGREAGGQEEAPQEPVVVYAGTRRLDPHRQIIGEPPLLDGALISLYAPVAPAALPAHGAAVTALTAYGSAKARLHVTGGPDAGGIHLLQGGKVHLGRSAEADVPLDDPDVSRLHCAVTVTDGGTVTVTDLGSTNGTTLDGTPVGGRPVLFRPGATLRIGETTIRLEAATPHAAPETAAGSGHTPATAPAPGLALPTVPDGEGRLRLVRAAQAGEEQGGAGPSDAGTGGAGGAGGTGASPGAAGRAGAGSGQETGQRSLAPAGRPGHPEDGSPAEHWGTGDGPGHHAHDYASASGPFPGSDVTHSAGLLPPTAGGESGEDADSEDAAHRRGRGLSAWARRFTGGRAEPAGGPAQGPHGRPQGPHGPTRFGAGTAEGYAAHPAEGFGSPAAPPAGFAAGEAAGAGPGAASPPEAASASPPYAPHGHGQRWPDPAAVLLSALGPGPRLWERDPGHPDALTVRLGVAHRSGGHGDPVTVDLRRAGSLGLAGPRSRLTGLARAVLAQLAALHGPSALEVVLLSADKARGSRARHQEWSWLGWLPHLRPAHGQDCSLLTAYDPEQATARTAELVRRLEAQGTAPRRGGPPGPAVVVVVDGDPGSADLRASVARLARDGAAAGIHLLALAETSPASPSSPVAATLEAANAACAAFPECGTVALLSGDVATAVRVLHPAQHPRQAAGDPAGSSTSGVQSGPMAASGVASGPAAASGVASGPVATVDAVSAAWAERFARALAPLREPEGAGADTSAAPTVTLPEQCRLLEELGLARATPAALLARWSERATAGSGRVPLVFGAGPHGPLEADLGDLSELAARMAPAAAEGDADEPGRALPGHTFVSGGPGSGKTELLRSLAASLAAGERPDRLALVLVDGAGAGAGEGLRVCAELPHVTARLTADDPVRMRQFAQALSAELKRRAELIGDESSYEEYVRLAARPGGRVVAPRPAPERAPVREQAPSERTGEGVQLPAPAPAPDERAAVAAQPSGRRGGGPAENRSAGESGSGGGLHTLPSQSAPRTGGLAGGRSGGEPPATGAAAEPDRTQRTLRLRRTEEPAGSGGREGDVGESGAVSAASLGSAGVPPRLVLLVDDFDTLVDPALGNPGRPAAGSVVRALEAVARTGTRLGVHVIAATGRADRTVRTELARTAALHVELTGGERGADGTPRGRGTLTLRQRRGPEGAVVGGVPVAFQAGRVTGRIPRTATLRPTVVPLDWARAGDPPARRQVRELGNGPTDLALLASAMERAAQQVRPASS